MVANCIIGVVGRRGSGKSTSAKKLLQATPRLFLFDVMGEHSWVPNPLSIPDWPRFVAWSGGEQQFAGALIPEDLDAELATFARAAYDRGDCLVGLEEVPMYCSPGALPDALDRLVRLGRHRQVSVVWTAQRMAEVARRLTAATDVFLLFRQTEPRDLEALAERCGAEVSGRVSALGLHDLVIWDVVESAEMTIDALTARLKILHPMK